jgi:hypothetical protein
VVFALCLCFQPLDRQSSKTSYDDYIYSPAFDINNQDSRSSLNDDNSSNMDSDFAVNFQNTDSMTSTNNENSNQSLKPVVVSCAKTGLGRGKPGFVYNAPNNGKKKQLSRKSVSVIMESAIMGLFFFIRLNAHLRIAIKSDRTIRIRTKA